jgi:diguanylate cyclase (GGDEF)-like protein/PAS domain S-box-containing protein
MPADAYSRVLFSGSWQFTPFMLPLLLAAAISAWVATRAWRSSTSGARELAGVMAVAAGWALLYAVELGARDLGSVLFWHGLVFLGIVGSAPAWLLFALRYTGRLRRTGWRVIVLLLLEPLIVMAIYWSPAKDPLLWEGIRLDTSGPFLTYTMDGHGLGFWLHVAYSYVLILVGTWLLGSQMRRAKHVYRGQVASLIACVAVPFVGNAISSFGLSPMPQLDLTPLTFTVTALCLALGIVRFQFLNVVPVARDAFFDSMSDAALVLDWPGRVLDLNPAMEALLGKSAASVIGQRAADMANHRLGAMILGDADFVRSYATGEEARAEFTIDGATRSRTFDVQMSPLRTRHGELTGRLIVLRDITERKRLLDEVASRRSEERFRSLVQHSSDVIAIMDAETRVQYVSPAVELVFGVQTTSLAGHRLLALVDRQDALRVQALVRELASQPGTTARTDCRLRGRDGRVRYVEATITNLVEDASVGGLVANVREVTERKLLEQQLTQHAFHDGLTGLANRVLFQDRIDHALASAARRAGSLAVLLVDLDDFKHVNDSLGHAAGDELLRAVGLRLHETLRGGDTAARLGGDEFALLLEGLDRAGDAEVVAARIAELLQAPFTVHGKELFVRTSIGIAVAEREAATAEDLLRHADVAMYHAKAQGKGGYAMFEPTMLRTASERLQLEGDLRRALDGQEFRLHYQPIVDLADERTVGFEALLRWQHPRSGLVPPATFIPIAEEIGLIVPLGRWVLREACRQLREWQDRCPDMSLSMSINVSSRQFRDPDLLDDVAAALADHRLSPKSVTLELTESVLLENTEQTVLRLRELRNLGVKLAIDDFGTGYSSLSYLQSFPVDVLKIDRSFMHQAGAEATDRSALITAIVTLARLLKLDTVAEGIERIDQALQLRALGCDRAQGYYFARPADVLTIEALLDKQQSAAA